MDPRHPELSVKRIRDLMAQYDKVEHDMGKAMTSAELAKLEREGGLVVQEICLTAPRMHEALIQTSRMRRRDLASGAVFGYKPEEKVGKYTKATIAIEEKPMGILEMAEVLTDPAPIPVVEQLKEVGTEHLDILEEEKPKPKKKTTKKKTTKKKAEK